MSSVPLRHLLATALLGDNESVESVLLSDLYSSGGSKNVYIDKSGEIAQILGYSKQNSSAVTSNTGGAAQRLRGLAHYISQSGGVITRQEIGIFTDDNTHWEFRKSTDIGVTWTFVADEGAGSANKIPSFAQSGNLLFMANGAVGPVQWDGTNHTLAGGSQIAAPTFTSTGAGSLSGNYRWRILPVIGNVRKLSSVESANYAIAAAGGAGHVDWTADADVTVTGYEIYRTTGTGSIFFYEGSVVGRLTVTFNVGGATDTDALVIANRPMAEFGDPPPVGAYFVVAHKERMFYLRTDANPRTAYYSDEGIPYSCNLAFNKVDFTDPQTWSDFLTGGTGDFQGMLVVWQERSVWVLSGTGQVIGAVRDFVRRRSNAQVGTVSVRTVTKIPAGATYLDADGNIKKTAQVTLAYLTPYGDIRLFDGDNDEVISFPKAATLNTAVYTQRQKSFCIHDTVRQQVTWVFTGGSATEPNTAVTWNYRWGTWYTFEWPFACGLEVESSSASSILLAGEALTAVGGFCYKLWSGFTFNGAAINSQWETKTLYGEGSFGDPSGLYGKPLISLRKRWRWTDTLVDVQSGAVTAMIEYVRGDDPVDAAAAFSTKAMPIPGGFLQDANGNYIQDSNGNFILLAAVTPALIHSQIKDSSGRHLHSRGLRIRYKFSTSTATWRMVSIDTAYQMLTGEKRSRGAIK